MEEVPSRSLLTKIRLVLRDPAAEFFGTLILVLIGTAVNCQVVLSSNSSVTATPAGDWASLSLGWACGLALGVWVSGSTSGGHLNPAVTVSLAVFRGFLWHKVPIYFVAQLFGAISGAALTYANYHAAIDLVEGGPNIRSVPGTASLFGTYAAPYVPAGAAWLEEFLGTAVLVLAIFAATDRRNYDFCGGKPPTGIVPAVLFVAMLGIATAMGFQTGFAINPARDLGPRILTAMVGYGRDVFDFRNQYWLWCPIIAPFCGGLAGAAIYDILLYPGGAHQMTSAEMRNDTLTSGTPSDGNTEPNMV